MRVLLTKQQMQALDRLAIEDVGIPSLVLMETAGIGVADYVEALFERGGGGRILSLAGLGNNGGDAVVAARHLAGRGLPVTLAIAGDPKKASPDLARQLEIGRRLGLEPVILSGESDLAALLADHVLVVDGLFGTGLSRPVEGLVADVIRAVNASRLPVVAVDIASGIDADTGQVLGVAISAAATVTFQHAKLGHVLFPGREHTGALNVVDIGIPRALLARIDPFAEVVEHEAVESALPRRRADSHKGTYGHLLIVAGAPERPGSALLAGRAALRSGAGLVTLGSDEETIRRLAPALQELMGISLGGRALEADRVLKAVESKSALAIGPSLSTDEASKSVLLEVLLRAEVPTVVDAGALTALATDVVRLRNRRAPTILTPHPGEMARLVGLEARAVQADRVGVARDLAERTGAHVLLKGASTVIASPEGGLGVITAGNAGMATGGAGDVLTGVIGALLAQGVPVELAARAGAQLHAEAGDRAAQRGEARMIASDILENLALEEVAG